jgi:hypothetical protein
MSVTILKYKLMSNNNMEDTMPLIKSKNNMEGTPPLRGEPYPTF